MPRLCTICCHPQREEIDLALARHAEGYRGIARRYGVDDNALQRHERSHLHTSFAQLQEAHAMLSATNLLARLASLDEQTLELLAEARASADLRAALLAVRESRGNLEAYSRIGVAGELERRIAALETGKVDDDEQ